MTKLNGSTLNWTAPFAILLQWTIQLPTMTAAEAYHELKRSTTTIPSNHLLQGIPLRLPLALSILSALLLLQLAACVNHDPYNADCEQSDLSLALVEVLPASGCGVADGSIEVSATGGWEPYTFKLGERLQSSPIFMSVEPGVYTVALRDNYGCEIFIGNISVLAEGLEFSTEVEEDTECLSDNGTITIDITEGNPPYQFAIDGGSFDDINFFEGLHFGNHEIRARDVNSCIVNLNVTVPRGLTGTSWSTQIKPIMEKSCATTGCHNGISRPDLRIYANAKKYSFQIKTLTADRSMPFDGPPLQQSEIDLIACWVDDGVLEN